MLSRATVEAVAVWLLLATATAAAQEVVRPSPEELAAITARGKMLLEYDQAAWHATDAVQMANPKTVEGQNYIAQKENGSWRVVFGKLNQQRNQFEISYLAMQQPERPKEFAVDKAMEGRVDVGFFLYAARAMELAMKDFGPVSRPYNIAVLPASAGRLYVYLYPAQAKARVYPLGADIRYLMSADGMEIMDKRAMHKVILEREPSPKGKKVVGGFHAHVLGDVVEDTDVFYVLMQDPPMPERVGTEHFIYLIKTDGTIQIEKQMQRKK